MIKPVVVFIPPAIFEEYMGNPACIVAHVFAIDHPVLGTMKVRTSRVISVDEDESFETLNTKYIPYTRPV